MRVVVCIVASYGAYLLLSRSGVSVTVAQLCAMPVLLLGLLQAELFRVRMPVAIAIFALVSALVSYVSLVSRAPSLLLLAPFVDDAHDDVTRVLRVRTDHWLRARGLGTIARTGIQIHAREEARAELNRQPQSALVVWGHTGFVELLLRTPGNTALQEFNPALEGSALGLLRLARSPSYTGLSFEPREQTARYLAAMTAAVASPESSSDIRAFEFRDAGLAIGPWRGARHRAFALFHAANEQFLYLLRQPSLEAGELKCVQRLYESARTFATEKEDPELIAGILNNQAVVLFLERAWFRSAGQLYGPARKLFQRAARIGGRPRAGSVGHELASLAAANRDVLRWHQRAQKRQMKSARGAQKGVRKARLSQKGRHKKRHLRGGNRVPGNHARIHGTKMKRH